MNTQRQMLTNTGAEAEKRALYLHTHKNKKTIFILTILKCYVRPHYEQVDDGECYELHVTQLSQRSRERKSVRRDE